MPRASASSLSLLLLVAACGGDQQLPRPRDSMPEIERVAPAFVAELAGEDGALLSVRDAASSADGLLLFDAGAEEVWTLALPTSRRPQRTVRTRAFGQADVFAMAAHSSGLSLLGVDGFLRVMQQAAPDRIARTMRAFAPIHRPMALGEWSAGGWVAVHALLVLQGRAVDSVIVSRVDTAGRVGRVFALERSGPSHRGTFLVDPVGARAFAGRVVIVGADPARVITVTPTEIRSDTLLETPLRPLNDSEISGLERMLAAPGLPSMIRAARFPDRRPVALSALPIEGGYLVVAQGGEFTEFLDLYCGRRFRRTVLARATLRRIFLVERGVVAIDEPRRADVDEPDRLAFYRSEDFRRECLA